MEIKIDSKVILKLISWLEGFVHFVGRFVIRNRSWCFVEGAFWVFRERRVEQEGESTLFMDRAIREKIFTVKIPAIKYASLDELSSLTTVCAGGNSKIHKKVYESLNNMTPKFLRYVNRRAEKGHNLYFDMRIDGYSIPRSVTELHSRGAIRDGILY